MLKSHLREILERDSTTKPKLREDIDPSPAKIAFICDRDENNDLVFDVVYWGLFATIHERFGSEIHVEKICNVIVIKLTTKHYKDIIDKLNMWRQKLIDEGTNRKDTHVKWLEDDQR